MKKIFTLLSLALVGNSFAQTWIHDTVDVGNLYVDKVFYSLENGETARYTNYGLEADLMIPTEAFTNEIYVPYGAQLFEVLGTNGDTTNWASLIITDATTIVNGATYKRLIDKADTYDNSAFAQGSDPAYGWGVYAGAPSHAVVGTRIFLMKTTDGNWKKVWVVSQAPVAGISNLKIRFADLDGTNEYVATIEKNNAARSSKFFIYYDVDTDEVLNPEPNKGGYDLVFTRWNKYFSQDGSFQPVTGALNGINVYAIASTGHANVTAADNAKYADNPIIDSAINTIGDGFKYFSGMVYAVADTNTYFVGDYNGNVWQLSFTYFQSGSGANIGRYGLKKRMIQGVSVEENGSKLATFSVFPNPAEAGTNVNLVYNLVDAKEAHLSIYDLSGRTVMVKNLNNMMGSSSLSFNTTELGMQAGIYIVKMTVNGQVGTQKVIIK